MGAGIGEFVAGGQSSEWHMMHFAFDSIGEFLAMGHYGAYVWSAWLISALGLALLIGHTRSARRQFYRHETLRLRQQQARVKSVNTAPSSNVTDGERSS